MALSDGEKGEKKGEAVKPRNYPHHHNPAITCFLFVLVFPLKESMKALKLITFDVTGTLLKFHPSPAVVYSQSAKDFGINVSAEEISLQFKPEWHKMSCDHPNFGRHTSIGWQNWWKMLVKNTFMKADPTLCPEDKNLNDLTNYLIDQYKTANWWKLTDGAENILIDLNAANMNVGVISNYDPRLEDLLESVGIRHYFKFVITSYATGVMKPNKKIFEAAQAQVLHESLQASNCMHVGNDLELDYKGAINCGWSAAIIDEKYSSHCEHEENYNVFSSLNELREKLKKSSYQIF